MKLKDIATQYNLDVTELACALGVVTGKELSPEDEVELTEEVVNGIKDFLGVEISIKDSSDAARSEEKQEALFDQEQEATESKKVKRKGSKKAKSRGARKAKARKQKVHKEVIESGDNQRENDTVEVQQDKASELEVAEKEEVKEEELGAAIETSVDIGQEKGSPHQEAEETRGAEEKEAVQEETSGGDEDNVPEGVGDERAVLLGEAAPPPSSTAINIDENAKLEVKEQVVSIDSGSPADSERVLEAEQTNAEPESTQTPVEVETVESVEEKTTDETKLKGTPIFIIYALLGISLLSFFLVVFGVVKLVFNKGTKGLVVHSTKYTDAELFALMYKTLEKGDYGTAEDLFSELKNNFPKSKFIDDAALYLGDNFFKKRKDLPTKQRYERAMHYYRLAYELTDRRFNKEKALLQIANCLFMEGRYKEAEKSYKSFIKKFPLSDKLDKAQYYLALTYYNLKEKKNALSEFWKVLDTYPNSVLAEKANYYLVKIYFEEGNFKKVDLVAARFIENWPNSEYISKVVFMYADALIKQGKVYKAIKVYENVEKNLSEKLLPELLFRKAKAYELEGNLEQAVKTYLNLAKRFRYEDLSAKALDRAAQLLTELGDFEQAVKIYYELKERFYKWKDLPASIYRLARVLAREARFKEAEKWLKFILEKYPHYSGNITVMWSLARILELEGEYMDAVGYYDKILLKLNPSQDKKLLKVYLAKADALLRARQYQRAIGVFISVLNKFKKYKGLDRGKILYRLSIAYFYNGDYAKAIDSFKDAIAYSPLNPWRFKCRYMLGRTYEEAGELQLAMDQYLRLANNKFLGDRSVKSLAFQALGRIYYRLGKYSQAYDCFSQARALSLDWHMTTKLLKLQADALVGKKDFDSAIKLYAKYLDRLLQFYHAELKEDKGGFAIVINNKDKDAADGFDKIAQALTYIADTRFRMGDYTTAMKVYNKIKKAYLKEKKSVPAWILFQIAMCYKEEGQANQAKKLFLTLQKEYPTSRWSKEANWQLNEMQIFNKLNRAKRLLQEVGK